jgi:hypothetical protein
LEVRIDRGRLRVRQGEPGDSRIEVALRSVASTREEAQALIDGFAPQIVVDADRVSITARCGNSEEQRILFRTVVVRRLDLTATLIVPRRQDLDLALQVGDIEVEDVEGTVRAAVQVGCVRIGSVSGDLAVDVKSGSIEIRRAGGRLVARAVTGHVHVEEAGEAVEISMESGHVETRILQPLHEASRISTGAGDIRVALAVGAEVEAWVSSGQVISDFALSRDGRGSVHGGGPPLTLRSNSGRVWLTRA